MGSRESKGKWPESRTVAGDIRQAILGARSFAEGQEIVGDDLARLCIVVEEIVANLFDHGGLSEGETVALALSRRPDGVGIIVTDAGTPFDLRAVKGDPNPERGGGAGIRIVKEWTRIVDYQSRSGLNRLELLMPLRNGE